MKTINALIVVSILILTIGCEDHLTLSPLDEPSNVTFYSNEGELILALNGVYNNTLWLNYGWNPNYFKEQLDLMTDLGFERSHGDVKAIADGSLSSSTAAVVNTWNHFYRGISRANNLLDNMHRAEENVPTDVYERVQAEARFLRAFSYFYLTELYGDVALILEVPDTEDAMIGRTSKNEVVDQIIADLEFAAQRLPQVWSGSDQGRATSGAALALKARVALFNERYDVASQAAQDVMNSGVYSLYPDYETLTLYAGERSSEVIFDVPFKIGVQTSAIPRSRGPQGKGTWALSVPSQFLVDSYEAIDGKPIDESSVYDPMNPFENRDPRLDGTIVRSQAIWGNIIYETHPDSTVRRVVDAAGNIIGAEENHSVTSAFGSFTGYMWRKYVDWQDFPLEIIDSELNFILIRYAEVLQIYAEARIEAGNIDQSVLDAINKVRARAYGVSLEETSEYPAVTTTDQSELRKIIRRERKVEFAGEGLRLFDIRRWKIAEHVMDGNFIGRPLGSYYTITEPPVIDEYGHPNYFDESLYRIVEPRSFNTNRHYLWPIPQPELDANDAMTQNPGY